MLFNQHSDLEGKHAFLSPSKYHWLRYSPEKLVESFDKRMTAARGSELHDIAARLIRMGIKLPNTMQTLNLYVNDCIGHRMHPEQTLYFSSNAFGTADAIDFAQNVLRIFDLKNGVVNASEDQLYVYAGLFCLEYKVRPMEIEYDLRIYQHDNVFPIDVDPEYVVHVMSIIVEHDRLIERWKKEMM